ncbi:MAG TPA: DUF4364 domain-containing protein [Ruminococcaceae bacterium]|nr:DUF4364 domain-containing protein [Oscillospiraceae bacterium]
MRFDAFTGGIEPGGLRSKSEIRILICYLLSSVGSPLTKDDIISIISDYGLANYFETADAVSDMLGKGLVVSEAGGCISVTDTGRMIAKQLDTALPPTIRDKAVKAAVNLLAKAKREKENKVEINAANGGYSVVCHISGGSSDLMCFSISVPDMRQALTVKKNFQNSPETIYRVLLALVTGDTDVAADIIKNTERS